MKQSCFLFLLALVFMPFATIQAQQQMPPKYKVDTRVDNMGYWRRMAKLGLVPVAPDTKPPAARYTTDKITGRGVTTEDSPDVPVTEVNSTQSENSIFVNPGDKTNVLNSNNSTQNPVGSLFGANDFYSFDEGLSWEGEVQGAGGGNSGDPTTAISNSGRYYVGYIDNSYGQSVSYSDNQGTTWTPVLAGNSPGGGGMLDKNHMWIDNSLSSPFNGHLYDAWTNFGGANDLQIEIVTSSTNGLSWSAPVNVSSTVMAGSHNQGVNLHTGPNGEAYGIWAIYDDWPTDETAIGFTSSLDGGSTWSDGIRILSNIRGIRTSATTKNMRVNSFPSMTVDISNGPHRGDIYVVWANIGIPGINADGDIDVYLIRSSNLGLTWSTPVRVNQDIPGLGKQHYFPWITCDPANGNLSVIFYDDRAVSSSQCEVFVANSIDGGETWTDFKVSDVVFTPQPISGLADSYFGDYLSITALDRNVYPCWTDNRTGSAMTYVSPYTLGPPPNQPYVIYSSSLIDDVTTGNGNGTLDFGEAVQLNLGLNNIGDLPATNVNVVLSSESPYLTLTDATENYGDFAVGEIKTIVDAFAFSVAENTPDGTDILFTVTATDANDSVFVSNFSIEVHSPALAIGAYSISDPTGNNNGHLDPGETADLTIEVSNPGDFNSLGVVGVLLSENPNVTINTSSALLDTIYPGQIKSAVFNLTVNPTAPIGSVAGFDFTASSNILTVQKLISLKIGLVIEDWETGDFTKFPWELTSASNWSIDNVTHYEGNYSARSGDIGDSQLTDLSLTYEVASDDSISFFRKVSSESNYDYLQFYVDGLMLGSWAGELDWERVAFPVSMGLHVFTWRYMKDFSVSNGSDAAWVDFIVLPAFPTTTVYAGIDDYSCGNSTYQLAGSATNYSTVQWSSSGTGTFNLPNSLSPLYFPSEADVAAGSVVLTITVDGVTGTVTDNLTLYFEQPTLADAGSDVSICSGLPYVVSEATAQNFTEISWTTSGSGSFSDPSILNTSYLPDAADVTAGSVTLTLSAGNHSCDPAYSSFILTILPTPSANFTGDTVLCEFTQGIVYSAPSGSGNVYSWTVNGGTITYGNETNQVTVDWGGITVDGLISLSVKSSSACQDSVNVPVILNALPVPMISGTSTVCAGQSDIIYSTALTTNTYLWEITGGTITSGQGTNEVFVNWTTPGSGSVSVTETIESTQCQKTISFPVTINGLLTVPSTPTGPVSVDLYSVFSSEYSVVPVTYADTYFWQIEPASAGNITGTTNSATVNWTADFRGTATISVKSANGCGESGFSQLLSVNIFSSLGINEQDKNSIISISPNPNNGKFVLKLNLGNNHLVSYRIMNSAGQVIVHKENFPINANYSEEISLDKATSGSYSLSLEENGKVIVKSFIIQ